MVAVEKKLTLTLIQKIHKVGVAVGGIAKGKENPYFKSKYFDINNLLESLNPEMKKEGLSVIQPLNLLMGANSIHQVLETTVSDGKDVLSCSMLLPNIQDPQKMGSAITYYRRYSLQAMFGLQAKDDDGNKASGRTVIKKTVSASGTSLPGKKVNELELGDF